MKKWNRILCMVIIAIALTFTSVAALKYANADTGQSVKVTSIDYDKMTLTISSDNGDSSYYYSDSKQKTWNKVIGTESSGSIIMDISWISVSKDYTLSLKGDKSSTPITVLIPKQNSSFKVTYNKAKGTVTYKGVPSDFTGDIEWRAKGFSNWNKTPSSPTDEDMTNLATKLSYYINDISAATIYFRTAPINGTSATETGARHSKEVTLSIPKKAAAPSISVDGTSLCVKVPAGVQYRVIGSTDTWKTAEASAKTKELSEIVSGAFCSTTNNDNPEDKIIEFRSEATSSKQISSSKYIRINAQESAADVGLVGGSDGTVHMLYLSSSTVKLTVDLDEEFKDEKYEYAITKPEDENTEAAEPDKDTKWTALQVSSKKEEDETIYSLSKVFTSELIKSNYKLWIRRKTTGTAGKDNYKIASAAYSWKATNYPGASSAKEEQHYIEAIRNTTYGSDITLLYEVDANLSEENTLVSAIKISTPSGTAITLPTSSYTTDWSGKICTVTINSDGMTELIANTSVKTDEEYSFYIKLVSGETIKTNTTLKVLTATSIVSSDTAFVKVNGYNKTFDLKLDFGTKLVADYDIKLICNGNPIENISINSLTSTSAEYGFSVDDTWLSVGEAKEIKVNICNKKTGDVLETITGVTVELKQPVSVTQMGSTTFTQGARINNANFSLTIISDNDVMENFTIKDIVWNYEVTGLSTSLINGAEIEQSGQSVTVSISAKVLNTLPAGSSKLTLVLGNDVRCNISYIITVTASSEGTSTSSLKSAKVVRTNKTTEASTGTSASSIVAFAGIDYLQNQLKVQLNGNKKAFYSTNKKTWYGIEGSLDNDTVSMNINWITSTGNYTLYLKGDKSVSEDDYVKLVIPKINSKLKAKFDKTSSAEAPTLTLTNVEDNVTDVQWRKKTDYNWNTISVNKSETYEVTELENLRAKGGKIVIRTMSVDGTDTENMGIRASKEVTLSIPKRAAAPSLKINTSKLTVNTTAAMEYYDTTSNEWKACTKTMLIWDIPAVAKTVKGSSSTSGSDVSVEFRKKATTKAGYSCIATVVFKGQEKAISFSNSSSDDVTYGTITKTSGNKETVYYTLTFNKASSTNKYQYVVVTPGSTYDEAKAKWCTVSKTSAITLSAANSVSGAKIYVRTCGVNANKKLQTDATLPSVTSSYTIP